MSRSPTYNETILDEELLDRVWEWAENNIDTYEGGKGKLVGVIGEALGLKVEPMSARSYFKPQMYNIPVAVCLNHMIKNGIISALMHGNKYKFTLLKRRSDGKTTS